MSNRSKNGNTSPAVVSGDNPGVVMDVDDVLTKHDIMKYVINATMDSNDSDLKKIYYLVKNRNVMSIGGSPKIADEDDDEQSFAQFNLQSNRIAIALHVLNSILLNNKKSKINYLEEFRMQRSELLSEETTNAIGSLSEFVFKNNFFNRIQTRWYDRDRATTYNITFIKRLIQNIDGYQFMTENSRKTKEGLAYVIAKRTTKI